MPKVRQLTHEKRLADSDREICERCVYELFKAGIKQKQIADALNVTEGAISKQIANRKLTLRVVTEIIHQTGADANKIMYVD